MESDTVEIGDSLINRSRRGSSEWSAYLLRHKCEQLTLRISQSIPTVSEHSGNRGEASSRLPRGLLDAGPPSTQSLLTTHSGATWNEVSLG